MTHSRWVTVANSLLRQYISTENLQELPKHCLLQNKSLFTNLAQLIVVPHMEMAESLYSRQLYFVVYSAIQRNFSAHPENILVSMKNEISGVRTSMEENRKIHFDTCKNII